MPTDLSAVHAKLPVFDDTYHKGVTELGEGTDIVSARLKYYQSVPGLLQSKDEHNVLGLTPELKQYLTTGDGPYVDSLAYLPLRAEVTSGLYVTFDRTHPNVVRVVDGGGSVAYDVMGRESKLLCVSLDRPLTHRSVSHQRISFDNMLDIARADLLFRTSSAPATLGNAYEYYRNVAQRMNEGKAKMPFSIREAAASGGWVDVSAINNHGCGYVMLPWDISPWFMLRILKNEKYGRAIAADTHTNMLRAYRYSDRPGLLRDKAFINDFCNIWGIDRKRYDHTIRELNG